jgi:hypothetical protein
MTYLSLLLIPIFAVLGSLAGKEKWVKNYAGDEWKLSTQFSRVYFFAFPASVVVLIYCANYGLPLWLAIISFFTAWAARCTGHASVQDNNMQSFWKMGIITACRFLSIILPIVCYAFDWCFLAITAVVWLLSWGMCRVSYLSWLQERLYPPLILTRNSSEWEEMIAVGAVIGFGLWLVKLLT